MSRVQLKMHYSIAFLQIYLWSGMGTLVDAFNKICSKVLAYIKNAAILRS